MPRALADPVADTRASSRLPLVPLLALATSVAAALRLPFLGTQSFWFDETYTLHVVRAGSLAELWDRVGASESTPPLFYLLTWAWTHALGSWDEAALRTVSALALVASVPVAYCALRRLAGTPAALASAWLVAVSPLLGWYALDARAYGLMVLTALLSVWAFAAILERPSRGRLALWALAAAAALWTHWFAGFLVLGEALALLWLRREARRGTLLAGGAALLALAPLAGLLREQTGDERAAFIAQTSVADRVEQLVRQFGAGVNVPRTWLEATLLAVALGGLAAGTWLTIRRASAPVRDAPADDRGTSPSRDAGGARELPGRDGDRALLALVAVGLLVPLAVAASGVYDRFNVRNLLYLWPLLAALAAPALLRLRAAPLAALLALGIATSLWTQLDWRYGNADWRGAVERIAPHIARDDQVIAVTPLGAPVAAHYLDRVASTSPVATRRAWLVVEPARSDGHRDLRPSDAPVLAQLVAAFPHHREQRVHGFRLIELTAPTPIPLDPAGMRGATLFPPAG
ncbi:MAG TPA: glycosyltransferase family 39 protein [Conexibacter sp.]